jgi:hypothetical protein
MCWHIQADEQLNNYDTGILKLLYYFTVSNHTLHILSYLEIHSVMWKMEGTNTKMV